MVSFRIKQLTVLLVAGIGISMGYSWGTIIDVSTPTAFTSTINGDTIRLITSIFDTSDVNTDWVLRFRNNTNDPVANVVIDLNGETLGVFCERTASASGALVFERLGGGMDDSTPGFHDILVKGPGTIMVTGTNMTGSINSYKNVACELRGSANNITFRNVNFVHDADTGGLCFKAAPITGLDGDPHSINRASPATESKGYYNIWFDSCTFSNNARNYYSRQDEWGSVVHIADRTWVPPDSLEAIFGITVDYTVKFSNCVIDSTPSFGIWATGLVDIQNCTFNTRAVNDMYEKMPRGKIKTVGGVLNTTGPNFDSGACYGCTSNEFEVGRRNWNGTTFDALVGQRSSTVVVATDGDSVWNDDWTTGQSAANAYALSLTDGQPGASATGAYKGSIIANNTFNTISGGLGSRGILMQNCEGSPAQPVTVRGNTFNLHAGPNAFNSEGNIHGLRIRWGAPPTASWDAGHYLIENNVFNLVVDGRAFDAEGVRDTIKDTTLLAAGEKWISDFGRDGEGIRVTTVDGEGFESITGVTLKNNRVLITQKADDPTTDVEGHALFFDNYNAQPTDTGSTITSHTIFGNYWSAPINSVSLGTFDANAWQMLIDSDTLRQELNLAGYDAIRIGVNRAETQSSLDNAMRDCVFLNGASETDIAFQGGTEHELTTQRTVRVLLVGNNGMGIVGATVELWPDAYETDTVLTATTAGKGTVEGVLTIRYDAKVAADSTAFQSLLGYQGWGFVGADTSAVASQMITTAGAPTEFGFIINHTTVAGTVDTTGWLTAGAPPGGTLYVKVRK